MTDIAELRDGAKNIHSIGPDRAAGLLTAAADAIDALRRDFAEARQLASRYGIELGPHFAAHGEHARTTGELRSNIPYLGTEPLVERASIPEARRLLGIANDPTIHVVGEERGCQPGTCLAEPRCRNRAEMRAAHGTPAEFAASIARAAPELLGSEAERAIVTYNAAWADATEPSAEVQRALNSELSAMGCNPASATQAEFKRALWSALHPILVLRGDPPTLTKLGFEPGQSIPGKLLHKHVWSESGDGCWDCLLSLGRLGVPVYRVPDLGIDVALTFPRELLEGLVLEVREVDGKRAGYLRLVRVEDLSTPIGAPSLAIAEQFDAEAHAAAEDPGTPGDGQGVDLWPGSGLPPLLSSRFKLSRDPASYDPENPRPDPTLESDKADPGLMRDEMDDPRFPVE